MAYSGDKGLFVLPRPPAFFQFWCIMYFQILMCMQIMGNPSNTHIHTHAHTLIHVQYQGAYRYDVFMLCKCITVMESRAKQSARVCVCLSVCLCVVAVITMVLMWLHMLFFWVPIKQAAAAATAVVGLTVSACMAADCDGSGTPGGVLFHVELMFMSTASHSQFELHQEVITTMFCL